VATEELKAMMEASEGKRAGVRKPGREP
jgi:hypothetical protein